MPDPAVELIQFPYSHFNEKARWGLAWKGVPHARRNLLPGPHMPVVKRLTGQTATPVLRLDGRLVAGSARILEALEERFPERPLFPADPRERARALAVQAHFDAHVGPAVRTALFSVMLEEPGYLCRMFSAPKPWLVRAAYRATFPLARPLMRRGNGVTSAAAVDDAFAATEAALDRVAREVGSDGHFAGGAFGVADLAVAALLAPCANPAHPDMARPEPVPAALRGWIARWADHPAVAWVDATYARYRQGAGG